MLMSSMIEEATMDTRIEYIDGKFYAIEFRHGREFTFGPFDSERDAHLELMNRQSAREDQ
jgi:hypothetical protein